MKLYQQLAATLRELDVEVIFGLMGDGNLFAMDSFAREHGGRFVSVAHEAAAVTSALGYAAVSGRLGVASTTHGPGITNTITSLIEASRSHTPLLLIAGDTPIGDAQALQRVDQEAVARMGEAAFEQVATPGELVETVARAVRRAVDERRPVVLNVPVEFMWRDVEPSTVTTAVPATGTGDPGSLDEAAGILASVRRPVVLAGRGAIDAKDELLRLARVLGAPVATSLKGRSLFAGEPENLGIFGGLSDDLTAELLLQADCVVSFGAGLNKFTAADGSLLDGRAVIQVDADADAIGRFATPTLGIVGDAAAVATALADMLEEAEIPSTGFTSPDLIARLAAFASARSDAVDALAATSHADAPATAPGTIDLDVAVAKLDTAFPADRTLVLDAGRFTALTFARYRVPEPRAYVHTLSFGSIGLGMGAAVGAAIARPDRPLLLVCGDGGFMLGGLAEFNTAVRHGTDLVVAVLDDGAYGAEHIQFASRGMDASSSVFDWPDLGPLATALGGTGYTVRSYAELDAALAALPSRTGPVLIDIKLDPDAISRKAGALNH